MVGAIIACVSTLGAGSYELVPIKGLVSAVTLANDGAVFGSVPGSKLKKSCVWKDGRVDPLRFSTLHIWDGHAWANHDLSQSKLFRNLSFNVSRAVSSTLAAGCAEWGDSTQKKFWVPALMDGEDLYVLVPKSLGDEARGDLGFVDSKGQAAGYVARGTGASSPVSFDLKAKKFNYHDKVIGGSLLWIKPDGRGVGFVEGIGLVEWKDWQNLKPNYRLLLSRTLPGLDASDCGFRGIADDGTLVTAFAVWRDGAPIMMDFVSHALDDRTCTFQSINASGDILGSARQMDYDDVIWHLGKGQRLVDQCAQLKFRDIYAVELNDNGAILVHYLPKQKNPVIFEDEEYECALLVPR